MQMHSKLFRQAYGLACLAVFSMIALVACGTGPGAKVQPSVSVAKQLPLVLDLEIGMATPIDLADKFSAAEGEMLTFKAVSDKLSVATAKVDKTKLTITAVAAGRATITVTATGSLQRERTEDSLATQRLTVIVPAPDEEEEDEEDEQQEGEEEEEEENSSSSTLTIKLGESAKRTLSSGQTLQPVGDGVKVKRIQTSDVWLIIAKKKGIHKVVTLSAGKPVNTITVEVPNSRPVRQDTKATADNPPVEKDLNNLRIVLAGVDDHKSTVAGVLVTGSAGAADDAARITDVPLIDYFTDDDKEPIYYRIEDKPPWLLIDTENGFVKDLNGTAVGFHLGYEVLQEVVQKRVSAPEFTVTLYASDGEMESTRPVFIEFDLADALTVLPPRRLAGGTGYRIDQRGTAGDFYNAAINVDSAPKNRLDVGPRRGVSHTVTFNGGVGDIIVSGFVFAEEKAKALDLPDPLTPVGVFYKDEGGSPTKVGDAGSVPPKGEQLPGTHYFLIRSTGTVVVKGAAVGDITVAANPQVTFELEKGSSGRSGNIIIEHHVWLDSEDDMTSSKAPLASKTLRIDVVTCNSPPTPIADCP